MNISITKNGFRAMKWDMDAGEYVRADVTSHISQLRSVCTIELDVTLADIFNAVEADGLLKEFLALYSWCDIDAFHAEAGTLAEGPPNLPGLECIEVSKYLEIDESQAREYVDIVGIGEPWGQGSRIYGIDLTPVNELAHLPVRLKPLVEVRQDGKAIVQAPASFTLLDVLGEIYWEISFHGSPVERDTRMADLRAAVDDVSAGTAELAPLALKGRGKETIH
jgi:hypothetical protein